MTDAAPVPYEPLPHARLRVGDTERYEAAAALGEHFATGRLDQAEYDTRVQDAYAARTRGDLERAVHRPAGAGAVPAGPAARPRRLGSRPRGPRAGRPAPRLAPAGRHRCC